LIGFHGGFVVACSGFGSVGVLFFGGNSVVDHVPESSIHLSTVAALVFVGSSGTVHQLLNGKCLDCVLFDGV